MTTARCYALAVALAIVGCSDATEAPAPESIELSAYDAKSDSLLTHRLELTITSTREVFPDRWDTYHLEQRTLSGEITSHTDESVSVSTEAVVFRAPQFTAPPPDRRVGWMAILSEGSDGFGGFGTEVSLLVSYREIGTTDWTPVQFPQPNESGNDYLFGTFAAFPGTADAQGWLKETPTGRCEVVYGRGDHDGDHVFYDFNAEAQIDGLDGDVEFRVAAVPSYNFCEWNDRAFSGKVSLSRTDAAWGGE